MLQVDDVCALMDMTGGHRRPVQTRLSRGVQGTRNACRSANIMVHDLNKCGILNVV